MAVYTRILLCHFHISFLFLYFLLHQPQPKLKQLAITLLMPLAPIPLWSITCEFLKSLPFHSIFLWFFITSIFFFNGGDSDEERSDKQNIKGTSDAKHGRLLGNITNPLWLQWCMYASLLKKSMNYHVFEFDSDTNIVLFKPIVVFSMIYNNSYCAKNLYSISIFNNDNIH